MRRIHDQLTDPADHLALDEAILLAAEQAAESVDCEAIRVWEFAAHVVIAGRSTHVELEIDRQFCDQHQIPILRRCSGGASVVGGPGCLMYTVVLSLEKSPELRSIDVAHQHVMNRVLQTAQIQLPELELQGICDLTWQDRKCSGNSLRVARRHVLYHGTILYDFDLDLIAKCLKTAPRQPSYRKSREHSDFVVNVPLEIDQFAVDLCQTFGVNHEVDMQAYSAAVQELRKQRYDSPAWNFRH
jgi:lipoate---protein ligase